MALINSSFYYYTFLILLLSLFNFLNVFCKTEESAVPSNIVQISKFIKEFHVGINFIKFDIFLLYVLYYIILFRKHLRMAPILLLSQKGMRENSLPSLIIFHFMQSKVNYRKETTPHWSNVLKKQ